MRPVKPSLIGVWPKLLCFLCLTTAITLADEPKNHDFDVIRDEASVPPYQLPPILVSAEGKAISTPEEWFNVRRPQILALFGNLVYGVVPPAESPVRTTFEVVTKDESYMGGKAARSRGACCTRIPCSTLTASRFIST